MSSIRDRIAGSSGYKAERVRVPEWDDVELEIRSISVKQRATLLEYADTGDGTPDMLRFAPMLLVCSVYDPETGEAALTVDDVEMLSDMPAGVVDRLTTVAMSVSGLGQDAVELGKDDS